MNSSEKKKFYVENLGCAKNQVDAEVMIAALKRGGWTYIPDDPGQADLIVVNTCGFIRSAQEEAVQALLGAARDYPDKKVLAAGCFAQRWADTLPSQIPELDGVFGNRAPHRVVETVDDVMAGSKPVFLPEGLDKGEDRKDFFGFDRSVFVKIADGCDNACRYCAIPLIKGNLISRPKDEILTEIRTLVERGAFELNLVAQDLASYGVDRGGRVGDGLLDLVQSILDIDARFWIRLLYLHPDKFPQDLPALVSSDDRLLPYFDIPFQHASIPVLRKMGRKGDPEKHLDLIRSIRDAVPHSTIRSTFLIGHPGEGNREFDELLDFQSRAQLDWLGAFTWSREEGTPAASDKSAFRTRLSQGTMNKRREHIEIIQRDITEARLDRWVGQDLDILIEEKIDGEDLTLGRGAIQAPEVDGAVVVHSGRCGAGDVIACRITGRTGVDLQAEPKEIS